MKLKRWQVISLFAIFIFIGIANVFSRYFENNPMYVSVWYHRLIGDRNFYIQEIKFKTPRNCQIDRDFKAERSIVEFLCAVGPKEFKGLSVSKATFSNVEDAKPYTENYIDNEHFVYMILGPKQGGGKFSAYYLKKQNVIVFSDLKDLAQQLVDELLRHDFHVASDISVERSK